VLRRALLWGSSFDYASRLTETTLLGLVALRVGQGRKVVYDGVAGRITNVPEAILS
jgi:hypothetical protein